MGFRTLPLAEFDVIQTIETSLEHIGFRERLALVLTLADRIVAACADTSDRGALPNRIDEAFTKLRNPRQRAEASIALLSNCQEPFLREVLRFGEPQVYCQLQSNKKRNNLHGIILGLGLLSADEAELDISDAPRIADPVRRSVLRAKENRNSPSHEAPASSEPSNIQNIKDVLVSLLSAVDRYRDALCINLRGLVVRSLKSGDQLPMLRMVDGERRKHLSRFKGRSAFISDILSQAVNLRARGGYILIMGPEGFGKSAIASKLSEEFSRGVNAIGASADAMRRDCPWLPGVLLHLGKQGREEDEIVRSLIEQANTCLLSKCPPPSRQGGNAEIDLDGSISFDIESDSDEEFRSGRRGLRVLLPVGSRTNHDEVLRRALYRTLEQLAFELGHVTFILDSLDEISPSGRGLSFLPAPLPNNVVGILTTRDETELRETLSRRLRPHQVQLGGLDVADVVEISGESDLVLNQKLRDSTQGSPLHVQNVIDLARVQGGLSNVDIPSAARDVFERQKQAWKSPGVDEDQDPLYALLLFLSVLERTGPISLTAAQTYLQSVGFRLSLNQVRELLYPVSSQIAGLDDGQVGIGVKPFSEFVLRKVLSSRDLEAVLKKIAEWLATDGDFGEPDAFIDPELRARFLRHWADSTSGATQRQQNAAGTLLSKLAENKEYDALCRLITSTSGGGNYRATFGIFERAVELAAEGNHADGLAFHAGVLLNRIDGTGDCASRGIALLKRAAAGGSPRAMRMLGERLIDGVGLTANPTEGEALLRRAVETGESQAMLRLGERLIIGKRLTANPIEGENLLRRAVDAGNSQAMARLGGRLIDGRGLPANPAEGEALLRRAVDAGNSQAMASLGERLIGGDGLPTNPAEGEVLLRRAVDAANSQAMASLGERLIDGDGLPANPAAGEALLRKAVDAGNSWAMRQLVVRLIDGDGLPSNPAAGEALLRRAVDAGESQAMLWLGERLIDGNGLPANPTEGEALLRRAVDAGNFLAMRQLVERLFDGKSLPANPAEGEALLRRAVDAGKFWAMLQLGERLIDGDGLPANPIEGEALLRRAVDAGNFLAMRELVERLFDGKGLTANPIEGEALLRRAVDAGNSWAMWELVERLIDGKGLTANPAEGEALLRRAIDAGESAAMLQLGERLISGNGLAPNPAEGELLLRKAVKTGNEQAMQQLAERLINGDGLTANPTEGEALLRRAVDAGNPFAMRQLVERLFDGKGLTANPIEGEALLRRAVDAGNPWAMWQLVERLIDGKGLTANPAEGEALLRRAADAGSLRAMLWLGERLIDGDGLPANPAEGEALLRRAANAGSSRALLRLGERLINGDGLTANPAEGESLLRRAADAGHSTSTDSQSILNISSGR